MKASTSTYHSGYLVVTWSCCSTRQRTLNTDNTPRRKYITPAQKYTRYTARKVILSFTTKSCIIVQVIYHLAFEACSIPRTGGMRNRHAIVPVCRLLLLCTPFILVTMVTLSRSMLVEALIQEHDEEHNIIPCRYESISAASNVNVAVESQQKQIRLLTFMRMFLLFTSSATAICIFSSMLERS